MTMSFRTASGEAPAPWPIGVTERLWLYSSVEQALRERAEAQSRPFETLDDFAAVCDHTLRWTERWAHARGVDVRAAVATRGGRCDCELLANVAAEDDDRYRDILLAGEIRGDAAALAEAFAAALEIYRAPDAIDLADDRVCDLCANATPRGLELPAQRTWNTLVAPLFDALATASYESAELVLVYPEAVETSEHVTAAPGSLAVRSLDALAEPWLASQHARLEAAVPRAPAIAPQQLALPAGALVFYGSSAWGAVELDGTTHRFDLTARELAVTADRTRAAWLAPFRTRHQLVVSDRGDIAVDRYRDVAFAPDGGTLYVTRADTLLAYSLATRSWQALGDGDAVNVSPTGAHLAVQTRGRRIVVMTPAGRAVATRVGGSPCWSPDGRLLAYVARDGDQGWQAYVLDVEHDRAQRISPACHAASWPTFTLGGDAIVYSMTTVRRRIPLADGNSRIDDDEVLVRCAIDGSSLEPLWSAEHGYMRITRPVAHPRHPWVAFRTQDAPQQNRRLALWRDGKLDTLLADDVWPSAWLGGRDLP